MSRTVRILLLLGGASVVALLLRQIGVAVMVDMFRQLGWAFLLITAVYTLHTAMRAVALWCCLGRSRIRFRDVARVRLSGEAVEMLTFTGPFLSEPTKGVLLKRYGIDTADAFGGLAAEYLVYIIVGFFLATGALVVLLSREALGAGSEVPIIGLLLTLAAFTMAFVYAAVTRRRLIAPGISWLGWAVGLGDRASRAAETIGPVEDVLVGFLHDRPARLFEVMGIEMLAHALLAADIWIALRALGFPVNPVDPFVLEGGIKLVGLIFFYVPAELGAAEGAYVVLATALKFGAAAGLTIALVRRVRALIIGLVGLAVVTLSREAPVDAPLVEPVRRRA